MKAKGHPIDTISLGHQPKGKWTFDASVARCFDDMLRRSIPQYDTMRAAVTEVARTYMQPDTWIVDLGCSKGEAMAQLIVGHGEANRFLGVELSKPMLRAAKERFAGEIAVGHVVIEEMDLRTSYPHVQASVTLAVLTLQFTPLEYRQHIVAEIFNHTLPGGAFILVEKVLGASAEMDALMVENYYRLKMANGYAMQEIDNKRHLLEGVLVPVTAQWNEDILRSAGFRHIECFWRWMNFAAWVAVRVDS